jgi:hypothetical protein
MSEKLSQAKTDNFAIWSLQYSEFWFSEEEMQEIEFPSHTCCFALDNPVPPYSELRKTSFAYQKNLPIMEFATKLAESFMDLFGHPETTTCETSYKYQHSFVCRQDGAKTLILSESDIKAAFDKFGIRGVYAFSLMAFAQLQTGKVGPLGKRMSAEIRETIESGNTIYPFEVALPELTKPIERLCWGIRS